MSVGSLPSSTSRLTREMAKIGCPELIVLDGQQTAEHLNYLDLMLGRADAGLMPQAVAEFQGRPALYIVDGMRGDGDQSPTDAAMRELGRLLANRSEHAALGIVRPGELTLYPVNLNLAELNAAPPVVYNLADPHAPMLFQSLATGSVSLVGQAKAPDYVFHAIHDLLSGADKALSGKLSPLEVLSVAGRALFFRFLHDRKIVRPSELADICPKADSLKDVFSDASCAAETSCWLDKTFNGDLLPLVDGLSSSTPDKERMRAYRKFFSEANEKTDGKVFLHLEAIMRGWKNVGGSTFQVTIDWDDFNFAHIPIGVLSQVYETFSQRWDPIQAEETSVHYTPKNIARLVTEEALAGVKNAKDAVILDPTCGAGVFLVLAFRQLVRLYWEREGRRPDKDVIHRILYKQIRGFDVSESALRLAALALYITAIEVNGTTRPPKILKFPRPLRNEVLFNFGDSDSGQRRDGFVLGSLSSAVPKDFDAKFDVVVGNPPWTRLRTKGKGRAKLEAQARQRAINLAFTSISRRALSARNLDNFDIKAYENPDNDPDLPFLWRAAEWAKPGGVIAMALPARILLKQSPAGVAAREAIFRGLTVSAILNGSDLEKTAVWPEMDLPFMLLFARNALAPAQHHFQFITPIRENSLSSRAEFRIDYRSAQTVQVESVLAKPWLLKALSVGSALDVEVWDKVSEIGLSTVSEIWSRNKLRSSEGYNISSGSSQQSALHLLALPDFEMPNDGFEIDFSSLQKWEVKHGRSTANRPREAALYVAPLVIVPQTPGETRDRPKSFLSETKKVAFSKSFYGYSTAGHRDATDLARLLYLVTHSLLWQHYCLTHSSRIGASYRTFLKEELDDFPFFEPSALTAKQRKSVASLVEQLLVKNDKPWNDIDELVFEFYGLSSHDAAIVRDTTRFGAPYRSVRLPGARPPSEADINDFLEYLLRMVDPFVSGDHGELRASVSGASGATVLQPWRFFVLGFADSLVDVSPALLAGVMREANRTAASRVIMVMPQGGLLVGLLNQLRYWSQSRARLCGLHIVRQHLSAFRRK